METPIKEHNGVTKYNTSKVMGNFVNKGNITVHKTLSVGMRKFLNKN
jgi:hypothetical protein